MAEKKKVGSTRRFGARYGRTTRQKFGEVEKEQRRLHKCPYCSNVKVKRIAAGIWQCRKCNVKFAGRAYSIKEKLIIKKPEEEKSAEIEQLKESD